ncbi:MAG TPA: tail fiber protein [Candidatus Eisenbacteria bacterium]
MTRERPGEPLERRTFLGRVLATAAGLILPMRPGRAGAATQDADPYLGQIMPVAFNYAPRGWALCNGQLLPINQNQALFSILLTTYGGNGITTFALPDLRGRSAINFGQGPGLTNRPIGQAIGSDLHQLTIAEMPSHTHVPRAASATATSVIPSGAVVSARNPAQVPEWGTGLEAAMHAGAIQNSGNGQSHANQQPYLTVNYIIAIQGIYPQP